MGSLSGIVSVRPITPYLFLTAVDSIRSSSVSSYLSSRDSFLWCSSQWEGVAVSTSYSVRPSSHGSRDYNL